MYTIYVVFKCVTGRREEYIENLKSQGIIDEIRKEDGCIRYDYYFSEKDPDEILLIEAWESKEKQQIHIKQPHMEKAFALKTDYLISSKLGEFELK